MTQRYLLLLSAFACTCFVQQGYAQSADIPKHHSLTGFSDPEPADPRYVKAIELAQLQEQVKTLTEAYGQLVKEQNRQTDRVYELERTVKMAGPPTPTRMLPASSLSVRKL